MAALVRSACMTISVDGESHAMDPLIWRFLRDPVSVKYAGSTIQKKPGYHVSDYRVACVPVDTFVSMCNNSGGPGVHQNFIYGSLDIEWTAVPVFNSMIGQRFLIPYIAAFMTSDLWSVTVNHHVSVIREGVDERLVFHESLMPCVNSVDISGPRRVLLVLMDETSQHNSVEFTLGYEGGGVSVPIWNGRDEMSDVAFGEAWSQFWSDDNYHNIGRDCALAYMKICSRLGV